VSFCGKALPCGAAAVEGATAFLMSVRVNWPVRFVVRKRYRDVPAHPD
jgi:hypothetical protein